MNKLLIIEKRIDKIKKERDAARENYTRLSEMIKSSMEKNSEDVKELKTLFNKFGSMKKSFDSLRSFVKENERRQEDVNKRMEDSVKEFDEVRDSLDDFKNNYTKDMILLRERFSSELKTLVKEREEAEKYLEGLKSQFGEKKRELKMLDDRVSDRLKQYEDEVKEILAKAQQMSDYVNDVSKRTDSSLESLRIKLVELEQGQEVVSGEMESSKGIINEKLKNLEMVMDDYTSNLTSTLNSKKMDIEKLEKEVSIKIQQFMNERDNIKKEFRNVFRSLNEIGKEIETLKGRDSDSKDYTDEKVKDSVKEINGILKGFETSMRNQKTGIDRFERSVNSRMEKLKEFVIITLDKYGKEMGFERKRGEYVPAAPPEEKGEESQNLLEEIVKELEG